MGAALGNECGQAGLHYGVLQYGRKTHFCMRSVQLEAIFPEGSFAGALANMPRIIEVNLIPCWLSKLGWVMLEVLPAPVFCVSK